MALVKESINFAVLYLQTFVVSKIVHYDPLLCPAIQLILSDYNIITARQSDHQVVCIEVDDWPTRRRHAVEWELRQVSRPFGQFKQILTDSRKNDMPSGREEPWLFFNDSPGGASSLEAPLQTQQEQQPLLNELMMPEIWLVL